MLVRSMPTIDFYEPLQLSSISSAEQVSFLFFRAGEPCDYLCSNLKSQCTQRYSLQRLLTCSSDRGLHLEWFKMPTSCGCQVEMSLFLAQSTTRTPTLIVVDQMFILYCCVKNKTQTSFQTGSKDHCNCMIRRKTTSITDPEMVGLKVSKTYRIKTKLSKTKSEY